MTSTPDPDRRKAAPPLRWLSTGYDHARATTPATARPTLQSTLFDPVATLESARCSLSSSLSHPAEPPASLRITDPTRSNPHSGAARSRRC